MQIKWGCPGHIFHGETTNRRLEFVGAMQLDKPKCCNKTILGNAKVPWTVQLQHLVGSQKSCGWVQVANQHTNGIWGYSNQWITYIPVESHCYTIMIMVGYGVIVKSP